MTLEVWKHPEVILWNQWLLDSYEKLLGHHLIERMGNPEQEAEKLFFSPFFLASHGNQSDPIYNYGNQTTLTLWEMTWEQLIQTPSRLTTEPPNREERERLLKQVNEQGYVENYQGIRISATGKRVRIEDITVWNIFDPQGLYRGQAATFSHWTYL